ncbi:MAG: 3-isopropylmalate dehydrogenase [Armatimonadetes bacterium]|nr:3-isopropylmalate dehydrogenase [Armatimonadota bacterium]
MAKIAVIPGDGIGTEVVNQGVRVLECAGRLCGFTYTLKWFPFGAEHYLKTGEIFPVAAFDEIRTMDAILLGAIGDPRIETGLLERGVVGKLRWDLDLYVNLRPVVLYAPQLTPLKNKGPEDINFIIVRENTEDSYLGLGGFVKKGTPDEVAILESIYTRKGVERIIRYAYELCRKRNQKKKLTLCDKANAIPVHDLWRRVFREVGREYPDITQDMAYVDATAMWMVKNPEWFDVIVTTNMFGDILSDLGAMLQGGMGICASGNIHPGKVSMFEPIHGSAPKYAGKNSASPIAAILSVSMMLHYLSEKLGPPYAAGGDLVERSVAELFASGRIQDPSASSGINTDAIGDLVLEKMTAGRPASAGTPA